jgi:hypothetical protein
MRFIYYISILFILSSCWPSSISFQDSSMPKEWKTFTVKTLESTAANAPANYPVLLSEKIKDGVQNNTKLSLNPKTGSEEITIEGIINNYNIAPIAIQQGDNAAKNRLTISVNFTIFVKEPKEEKMTLSSIRFADYDSNADLTSIENQLLEEINEQIVRDVINKLFSNW